MILGVVPTLFGHNSLYYAVKYISPSIIASVPLGEPIIASVLAFFIFKESITSMIIISGLVIVLCLLYLINTSKIQKEIN